MANSIEITIFRTPNIRYYYHNDSPNHKYHPVWTPWVRQADVAHRYQSSGEMIIGKYTPNTDLGDEILYHFEWVDEPNAGAIDQKFYVEYKDDNPVYMHVTIVSRDPWFERHLTINTQAHAMAPFFPRLTADKRENAGLLDSPFSNTMRIVSRADVFDEALYIKLADTNTILQEIYSNKRYLF